MAHERRSPEEAGAWIKVARDAALVAVGVFMLVWQTIWEADPSVLIVGAGLTCLGLPLWLRLDEAKNGNGK